MDFLTASSARPRTERFMPRKAPFISSAPEWVVFERRLSSRTERNNSDFQASKMVKGPQERIDGDSSLKRPDYGLDAPPVVGNLTVAGGSCLAAAGVGYLLLRTSNPGFAVAFFIILLFSSFCFFLTVLAMIWSSRWGKLLARDRLMDSLDLKDGESVLDVGCGRGLLLIGAAKKLQSGKAIGLDIWQTEDLSGNAPEVPLGNARLEGVADRVEAKSGDMRKMPFPDFTFDAVVSNIAIHNIPDIEGRRKAIAEIDRVLRTGGRIGIMDFRVDEYVDSLRSLGWVDLRVSKRSLLIFPPVRMLTGTKPVSR